jgi:hypothetical protein
MLAATGYAEKQRSWSEGILESVETVTIPVTPKRIEHRYICVVSAGSYAYTVEYTKPVKIAIHDPAKFVVEKDTLILLDADGRERSARIEKRERIVSGKVANP